MYRHQRKGDIKLLTDGCCGDGVAAPRGLYGRSISPWVMERHRVDIEYGDPELRCLAEDPSFSPRRWGRDVVVAYRKKIQILRSATDERDLRNMRSLNLEKLKGDRAGVWSIRLNDQFRLILTFHTGDAGRVTVVLELVDYH